MHTYGILTGRHASVYLELATVFTYHVVRNSGSTGQRVRHTSTTARERVTFSDLAEVIVVLSIFIVIKIEAKMSFFQPNCRIENCTS